MTATTMLFLHRYLRNPILSFLEAMFFQIPIKDFHCGLRGFSKSAIQSLGLWTSGMEFASEMVVKSALKKIGVVELPTTLRPDGRSRRAPHLKIWRDGGRHLKFLLTYSPKWLFIYPEIALTTLGAGLGGALMTGPLKFVGLPYFRFQYISRRLLNFGHRRSNDLVWRAGAILCDNFVHFTSWPRSNWIVSWCQTGHLIIIALCLVAVGCVFLVSAVAKWADVHFGVLSDPLVQRFVTTGFTFVIIGIQTSFSAFLFGILSIPMRAEFNE